MKTIFILLDSLNRHYLPVYGNNWVQAPNITRLAQRGVTFDRHYCASAPCMPARRDMFTGRHTFLETPWGPLEPYDATFPRLLREQSKTYSHMITDHYHYWEWFGMGYNTDFDTWEFERGQEGDPWHPSVRDPQVPPFRGRNRRQDWVNRSRMNIEREEEYPTPRCFQRAIEFLDHNHDADNWFLHLECFDPHEPFFCPQKYHDLYNDTWSGGYHYDWPHYKPLEPEDDPAAIEHIRKCYAGTLTMADVWLGKLLDKMDALDLWKDTTVVLTTDHGYLLGEHGYWAKNYPFPYNELMNIPLIISQPGSDAGARRQALTSTVDLMPTFLERYGAPVPSTVHGRSLCPVIEKDAPHHEGVLFGWFGHSMQTFDGRYVYSRNPGEGTFTHHHTAMATHATMQRPKMMEQFTVAETGKFLDRVPFPIYRVPVPSLLHRDTSFSQHRIYDLVNDPQQNLPVQDDRLEAELSKKMVNLLEKYEAPPCQFERLGLEKLKQTIGY